MTVDEIYQNIGQTISDGILEDWTSAELRVNRLDKYVSIIGTYVDDAGNVKQIEHAKFDFLFSLTIHELHSIMTAESQNRWNKLLVRLKPSGKFEMDFIWDQGFQDKINSA